MSFRDNLLRITICILLVLIGDIEFLIPAIIFVTLDFFFNKKILYGLLITFLILLSKICIFYLVNQIYEQRNLQTFLHQPIVNKILEIIYNNSITGENNIFLNRIIYSITEIIGNFQASILISSSSLLLLAFYLIYKNFKSIIENEKFLTLFCFLIIWDTVLWNYTDIRFYPFLIITVIQLFLQYFDKNKIKKTLVCLSSIIPLEILLRSF